MNKILVNNPPSKRIRVFHGLVNYGTQSGVFAKKLREKGLKARSVTVYDKYLRVTDTVLKNNEQSFLESNGQGIKTKLYNFIWNNLYKVGCFFRFNVFHFYFGHTLTNKKWDLFIYRFFNKKIVCHYLGIDVQMYQMSIDKYETTNVELYIKNGPQHDELVLKRLARETKYADLQLVCAPYLSEFVPNSTVLPLAIDLNEYCYSPKKGGGEDIVIMHAPTSRENKGSADILNALDQLIVEGYPIRKLLIENITHEELKDKYKECDIFVDQVLGGWYGTASIEAMAIGRPVVCFIREEYFKYIDYGEDIPIISANPVTIYSVLKNICDKKEDLHVIGKKSRKFVENIHDAEKVTEKLIALYEKLWVI